MSDYEVNIKILLSEFLAHQFIKSSDRNKLLEKATNQVTQLVLSNNIRQHQLISMDQFRSMNTSSLIEYSITTLINEQRMSISDEQIPDLKGRQEYYHQDRPLPRSILAKCQAYTKMKIKDHLIMTDQYDLPEYESIFVQYFPPNYSIYYDET